MRGQWMKDLTLAPDTYEYCLIVDGHWKPDPSVKKRWRIRLEGSIRYCECPRVNGEGDGPLFHVVQTHEQKRVNFCQPGWSGKDSGA